MRISGHVTDSVFRRYNITDESDIAQAALKIDPPKTGVWAEFGQSQAESPVPALPAKQATVAN
jgi:hypothetical protein